MTWQQLAIVLAFLVLWFVLNRWLLPALGIPTCMSGQCGVPRWQGDGPTPATPVEHDAPVQHDARVQGEKP